MNYLARGYNILGDTKYSVAVVVNALLRKPRTNTIQSARFVLPTGCTFVI